MVIQYLQLRQLSMILINVFDEDAKAREVKVTNQ